MRAGDPSPSSNPPDDAVPSRPSTAGPEILDGEHSRFLLENCTRSRYRGLKIGDQAPPLMLNESTARRLHAKAENGCHLAISSSTHAPLRCPPAPTRSPSLCNSSSNICDNSIFPSTRPNDPSINCVSQRDALRQRSTYFRTRCDGKIIGDGNDD